MAERLTRLKPDADPVTGERLGRYGYRGYEIERCRRSWSERNGNQVGGGVPLYWWSVYTGEGSRVQETDTLAAARAWIDEREA